MYKRPIIAAIAPMPKRVPKPIKGQLHFLSRCNPLDYPPPNNPGVLSALAM